MRHHVNDIDNLMRKLRYLKVPHTRRETNLTTYLDTPNSSYIHTGNRMQMSDLSFVGQVVKHVRRLDKPNTGISNSDISYFKFNDLEYIVDFIMSKKRMVEIDVNSAYWNLAYKLGYISKKIYDKGNNPDLVSKKTRLIALGAMASVKKVYTYDIENDMYIYEGIECDEKTRSYFMHIAKELDDIMRDCIDSCISASEYSKLFIFYWVDAFFVAETAMLSIMEYFKKHTDLGVKVKLIEKVTYDRSEDKIYIYDPGVTEPRVFTIPSNRSVENILNKKLELTKKTLYL